MSSPPVATYRLQLHPGFGFAEAADLVDYLADLGISHLYLSPILAAREGSTHGYDVVDPSTVSPALGGEDGLRALHAAARARGLGLTADIVPNHVGTGPENALWESLLAGGNGSDAARVFDVDWYPPLPGAEGKVILPVLGAPYGQVLHAGELEVAEDDDRPRLRYYDHSFPLSDDSVESMERVGGIASMRGTPGEPESWNRLHALLENQHYRLVFWRSGQGLVNYRRFFTINELAAVRVEDEAVFDRTHERILALVSDGVLDGLRIDHPDGLRDPAGYLKRLAGRTGGVWTVVEKILATDEQLPDWPVAGTTGYEFANDVVRLFVDPSAEERLVALERDLGVEVNDFDAVAAQGKREILDAELAPDLDRLAGLLWQVTQQHLEARDVTLHACRQALRDALIALDVYRTYTDPATGETRPEDEVRIELATGEAAAGGTAPGFLVAFLADVLAGRAGSTAGHLEVIARFQQLSGAVTAKGVEDTAFYRYRRLLALNEVGGHPSHATSTVEEFHAHNLRRAQQHPTGMLSTTTHDTKRGEDVRMRIAALSEMGSRWTDAVRRWRKLNAGAVTLTDDGPAPDPSTELLLYQTLVGVWPLDGSGMSGQLRRRVTDYSIKACREAKDRTSWIDIDETFEAGVTAFCELVLDRDRSEEFLTSLAETAGEAARIGMVSALAQTLLRCTVPGVPDTYQGEELWDDNLVDPDNRRPVDYELRRRLLTELADTPVVDLWEQRRDGRIKLAVLTAALGTRREVPACFGESSGYVPLEAVGSFADHVVAYLRTSTGDEPEVLVAVPRLVGGIGDSASDGPVGEAWGDTELVVPRAARRPWTDRLSGARHDLESAVPASTVFRSLPVALLTRT